MLRRFVAAMLMLSFALVPVAAGAQEGLRLSGALLYTAKVALAKDALMVVQLQTLDGRPFTTIRRPTQGAQVPLPFSIQGPANAPFGLRAALFVDGRALWASPLVVIQPGHGQKILPPVILNRVEAASFARHFSCGKTGVEIAIAEGAARMRVAGHSYDLTADTADPDPRYVAAKAAQDARDTWFQPRGNAARVSLGGKVLPVCKPEIAPMLFALHARGGDPDWRLDLAAGRLRFVPPRGDPISAAIPAPGVGLDVLRFDLPGKGLAVVLTKGLCHEGTSPLPFPIRAKVTWGTHSYQGCAGTPAQLLEGAPWKVLTAAGTDISRSGTEMRFLANQISGKAPCNRFSARLLFGAGMRVGPLAATRNTCAALTMNKEQAFFNALGATDRFDIKDGKLRLLARGQTVMEASR
ncbi:hypothetical protein U879_01520 [Defluviimonas sp. 20V17]|uniref:HslJ n=1 Tax=Allgaiera indica TaxID=765699 RepID=A0AAN5A0K3_9RHOB|nr:META domain-containing protein [Allgaiera indica]KDB05497.1 hypothetical protein U879_01520 [Defluviimonas sp. 20V17]GHE04616.1 HslJ [Allgaiera indica]SDX48197.1 Heat shock protein HslJ [Allgaiera indica]